VKLFLNLSKEEQRMRFLKQLDLPEKNWKFSAADARERARWDDLRTPSQMLSNTSTKWAPWYVIPADHSGSPDLRVGDRRGCADPDRSAVPGRGRGGPARLAAGSARGGGSKGAGPIR
jgi:hypothetical protein